MKKLLSLMLALLMGLCTLLPACAETSQSIPFTVFQENYAAIFSASMPDAELTWVNKELDGVDTWGAMMNNALPLVMVTTENGNISNVAVLCYGDLTEDDVAVFLLMCTFAGSALYMQPGDDPAALLPEVSDVLFSGMTTALNGSTNLFTALGMQCKFETSFIEEGEYEYLMVFAVDGAFD